MMDPTIPKYMPRSLDLSLFPITKRKLWSSLALFVYKSRISSFWYRDRLSLIPGEFIPPNDSPDSRCCSRALFRLDFLLSVMRTASLPFYLRRIIKVFPFHTSGQNLDYRLVKFYVSSLSWRWFLVIRCL